MFTGLLAGFVPPNSGFIHLTPRFPVFVLASYSSILRMKTLTTLIALMLAVSAFAQNTGSIRGQLKDTATRQNMQGATVSVLDKDSTLITFAIAKADGSFQVNRLAYGTHLLLISFQGFSSQYKTAALSKENPVADLGTIIMIDTARDLGNINIISAPVTIKGDTTEFSANAFKTKPNATAEDLLKKLPGVQVEKDGTVKAQGEDVKKVLVDGKKFFGDDPKMATRNLPSDVIDKVQVYDGQSEQAAFSGFDDGNREKTINIITKKDRRKGYFGRASAGAGDNERYAANVSINRFNGNQQISFIGQANNTNQQNFSMQDILGVMGGGGMFGSGGAIMQMVTAVRGAMSPGSLMGGTQSGIARTLAAGLNYNDAWSKNTSVSGSYFYNNMNVQNGNEKFRETFGPKDSSMFTTSSSFSRNQNQNHRFNIEIDHRIDSFNSILFRPSISFQQNDGSAESASASNKAKLININQLTSSNVSDNKGYNFNNSLLFRHRFMKKGRTLSLNLTQAFNEAETDRRDLNYTTTYFNSGSYIDTADLLGDIDRRGWTLGGNLSYTEPAGKKALVELSYNYSRNQNESGQVTERLNNNGKYERDSLLTNEFLNTNESHRLSMNYRRQVNKDWSYTAGIGVQRAALTSDNKSRNTSISQDFYNFFPTLSLQYSKNRVKNLRLNYRGSTRQPSVSQLQDVIDITNPLSIRGGNPGLRQEFVHNINLMYTSFDIFTFKNFFAGLNGGFTSGKIGNQITTNLKTRMPVWAEDSVLLVPGAQYTKPVNLDGAYNLSSFVNVGFRVKSLKANLNFTTTAVFNRDVSSVRDISESAASIAYTRNYILGERISLTMNLKERFDLNFSSASSYTFARYSRQPQLDGDYFSQVFSVEPTYSSKTGWIFGLDFDYSFYKGQSEGYNQSIPLLNASISKQVFKNKAGEIRLSAFDLLNQNQSITRNIRENYVEDVNTMVLQRYFMISFTYHLRKFGLNAMPGFLNIFRGGPFPGGGHMRVAN